jgi:hypothetical protein
VSEKTGENFGEMRKKIYRDGQDRQDKKQYFCKRSYPVHPVHPCKLKCAKNRNLSEKVNFFTNSVFLCK